MKGGAGELQDFPLLLIFGTVQQIGLYFFFLNKANRYTYIAFVMQSLLEWNH